MFINTAKFHFNRSQITPVHHKNRFFIFFSSALLSSVLLSSCEKESPDQQTLHFTTLDGIKTTLDFELEMYRADNNADLFYMNFRYYTRTKTGQWSVSAKPDGPWKVFPDQNMAPKSLLLLKK